MVVEPIKDTSTVTADGDRKLRLIDGVRIRPAVTHVDERGTLAEIYNPDWGIHEAPIVYVYQFTIRPGKVKGWIKHALQDDRLFISQGRLKVVIYDVRPDSPTYGQLNEIYISEYNRSLLVIPIGVYHALQNVGDNEVVIVNLPTQPYNHEDPDKFRLPLDTDQIPYRFEHSLGW